MTDERYVFQGFYIPERMMGGLRRWKKKHGIPPGGFLNAVLCNNLSEAVGRADEENMHNLPAYAAYLHDKAPCWGSPEKVAAWAERLRKWSDGPEKWQREKRYDAAYRKLTGEESAT